MAAWQRNNREKVIAKTQRWQKANPEKTRSILKTWRKKNGKKLQSYVWKKYGLDPEAYARLLTTQNGLCYLCRQPETQKRNGVSISLSVDHCHVSGCIRSLLCARCNTVLGLVEEDLALLENMMGYLKKYAETGGDS